jgi:hypothetical protein
MASGTPNRAEHLGGADLMRRPSPNPFPPQPLFILLRFRQQRWKVKTQSVAGHGEAHFAVGRIGGYKTPSQQVGQQQGAQPVAQAGHGFEIGAAQLGLGGKQVVQQRQGFFAHAGFHDVGFKRRCGL